MSRCRQTKLQSFLKLARVPKNTSMFMQNAFMHMCVQAGQLASCISPSVTCADIDTQAPD